MYIRVFWSIVVLIESYVCMWLIHRFAAKRYRVQAHARQCWPTQVYSQFLGQSSIAFFTYVNHQVTALTGW